MMQKYLLSNVFRTPDDPAAPDPTAVDPAVVGDPVTVDPAPDPAGAADPALLAPAAPAMVPLRIMLERVGEETSKRQTAEEAARVAIERAKSFEEITKRLQADPKATPAAVDPAAARPAAIDQQAVQQEAARQRFAEDVQGISDIGLKTYGAKWNDAITALNAYGANSEEFVSNVMDVDKGKTHDIMFQIAQDGELAVRLTKMTPTRRIAEITRMVMAQTATADPKPADPKPADPKPAALSRAPAPKPAIAPHAPAPDVDPRTPEGDAKMDDKEWEAWYKKTYMKRTA